MKSVLTMKNPYDVFVGICGIVAGCFAYLRANLDLNLLDVTNFISWEKVFGLLWGCLVALLTGMAALGGKSIMQWAIRRYFKKK